MLNQTAKNQVVYNVKPDNPPAGYVKLYPKNDGLWYVLASNGSETTLVSNRAVSEIIISIEDLEERLKKYMRVATTSRIDISDTYTAGNEDTNSNISYRLSNHFDISEINGNIETINWGVGIYAEGKHVLCTGWTSSQWIKWSWDGISWNNLYGPDNSGTWTDVTYNKNTQEFLFVRSSFAPNHVWKYNFNTGIGVYGTNSVPLNKVVYGNDKYVGITNSGIYYSSDGNAWTSVSSPLTNMRSIEFLNNLYIIASLDEEDAILVSQDGISWTQIEAPIGQWRSIAYGNGKFVILSTYFSNQVAYSHDGYNWTFTNSSGIQGNYDKFASMQYANGQFVAFNNYGGLPQTNAIAISPDGVNWTKMYTNAYDFEINAAYVANNNIYAPIYSTTSGRSEIIKVSTRIPNISARSFLNDKCQPGELVLIKDQMNKYENGIYVYNGIIDTPDANGNTIRSLSFTRSSNHNNVTDINAGSTVFVPRGESVDVTIWMQKNILSSIGTLGYQTEQEWEKVADKTVFEFDTFIRTYSDMRDELIGKKFTDTITNTLHIDVGAYAIDALYENGVWVMCDQLGLYLSYDGITWEQTCGRDYGYICSCAYGNGMWIALGETHENKTFVLTSTDNAKTWNYANMDYTYVKEYNYGNTPKSICYHNGNFFASYSIAIIKSADGIAWRHNKLYSDGNIIGIQSNSTAIVHVAIFNTNAYMRRSIDDGDTWTDVAALALDTNANFRLEVANNIFFLFQHGHTVNGGKYWTSVDGLTWTARTVTNTSYPVYLYDVAYDHGYYKIISYIYKNNYNPDPDKAIILITQDFISHTPSYPTYVNDLAHGVICTGNNGVLILSQDNANRGVELQQYGSVTLDERLYTLENTAYKFSPNETAPLSQNSTGTKGEVIIDGLYMYVCVATNTWRRTELSSW